MADSPGPQTVALLVKELAAQDTSATKELVHLELDLTLNLAQREIYNLIMRYTSNNQPLRIRLIGVFLAAGSAYALSELRKAFPKISFNISNISQS